MKPILYDFTLSIRCQIVRLALREKDVDFDSKQINLIAGEQLAQDFVKVNPNRTVPTLEIGTLRISDTLEIIRYIDKQFGGPKLTPIEPAKRDEMNHWIGAARLNDQLPDLMLYDANRPSGARMQASLDSRMKQIESELAAHPNDNFLNSKLKNHRWLKKCTNDPKYLENVYADNRQTLQRVNDHLSGRTFFAGGDFSLADVVWIPVLARLEMLGELDLSSKPALENYYLQAQKRPTWISAQIVSKFPSLK